MTGNEANMSIKYAVCVLEAIGNGLTLSNENDREVACAFAIQAIEEKQQYRAIGTIEEFKALKEKSVAKKPIRNDLCTCPSCGTYNEVIKKRRNTVCFDTVYCWHCGQAMEIKRD